MWQQNRAQRWEADRLPPGRQRRQKGWTDQQSIFWYRVGLVLFGLIFRYWIKCYQAFGSEHVPASGGVFLVANHTTAMDPFILGHTVKHRMLRGPGKVQLFKNRFIAYFMKKIGMFPLRQDVADAAAVRTMVELYRNGRVVVVYPEGGRSPTGEMRPFFPDFARLVIRLRAPIVPAAIAGGKELMPMEARFPRRHSPVTVVYGQAFELAQFYDQELTAEIATQAALLMAERVAELLAQARREREKLVKTC